MSEEIEIVTKEEEKKESRVKGFLDRLFQTRISYKKLLAWIIIIGLIVISLRGLERKYPTPAPDMGFKFAYKVPIGYIYIFSYGPNGINYIDQLDYAYSDLECYLLSKYNTTATIKVTLYDKKKVNGTTVYVPIINVTKKIKLRFFEFTKVMIDMPHIDKMLLAVLEVNGQEVVKFYYRYNIYYAKIQTIVGELFITQIIYMIVAIVIYLIAMIIAKQISKITAVPEANPNNALMTLIVFGMILYVIIRRVIFEYGLYQAIYFYPVLFLIAFISALYLVSPEPKRILLIKTNFENTMIEIVSIDTRIIRNRIYKIPTTIEFLFYKPVKLTISKRNMIFRAISELYDYVIYYRDMQETNDEIKIIAADIHALRLEDYKTDIRKVEIYSKTIEEQKNRIKDLEVKLKIEPYKEALDILKRMRDEVSTWKGNTQS